MLLTGHKSRAIFDRYNIINEQETARTPGTSSSSIWRSRRRRRQPGGGPTRPALPPRAPPPSASCDAPPRKGARYDREPGGGGRTPPVCAPQVASSPPYGPASDRGTRGNWAGRRGRTRTRRARPSLQARRPGGPDALLGDMQSDRLGGGSPSQRGASAINCCYPALISF